MAGGSAAQRVPLERLVVIVSRLSQAGGRPVEADELLALVSYGAAAVQDQRDQLQRDVRQLVALGWDIENVAPPGSPARYRLGAVDNRLRVQLDPQERFALLRVARLAHSSEALAGLGVGDAGAPDASGGGASAAGASAAGTAVSDDGFASDAEALAVLDPVAWARAHRCLLRFDYKGRSRVVHPFTLSTVASGWYLLGLEVGQAEPKLFRLSRMSGVHHDDPGTALPPPPAPPPPALDPLAWPVDPPLDADVLTAEPFRDQVRAQLGTPREEAVLDDGTVRLTIAVTHREAFLARLVQLGERVRLEGPAPLRDALRARLLAVVAADAGVAR